MQRRVVMESPDNHQRWLGSSWQRCCVWLVACLVCGVSMGCIPQKNKPKAKRAKASPKRSAQRARTSGARGPVVKKAAKRVALSRGRAVARMRPNIRRRRPIVVPLRVLPRRPLLVRVRPKPPSPLLPPKHCYFIIVVEGMT